MFLEEGIERAQRSGGTVSPRLTAELHYELGTTARVRWRARANLGRLPAAALADSYCPRAPTAPGDPAPVETMIAWNYLCSGELSRILATRFEPDPSAWAEHNAMRSSFQAAVAANPGHVGANVELLLDMAESGNPRRMLATARRFAYASRGHPYARLLSGLALQRIGRSEDALQELEAGLAGLSVEVADRIRDIRPLLDADAAERFAELDGEARARRSALLGVARPARLHPRERAQGRAPGALGLRPPPAGRSRDGRGGSLDPLRGAARDPGGGGVDRATHGVVGLWAGAGRHPPPCGQREHPRAHP